MKNKITHTKKKPPGQPKKLNKPKKKRFLNRKRKWDIVRGIVIVDYTESNASRYDKNLISERRNMENMIIIDDDSKHYNQYLEAVKTKDGIVFIDFIRQNGFVMYWMVSAKKMALLTQQSDQSPQVAGRTPRSRTLPESFAHRY